ncbi:RHS repeat domain-containing protein [Sphingobacterium alkalisoli]|nr:DUF6443 domain-containing protein [Sphingobacterium alkalisoli]
MKILGVIISTILLSQGWLYGQSTLPKANRNYIMELLPRRGYVANTDLFSKPVDSVNRNIKYFDGVGRLVQRVGWHASPSKTDIVDVVEYNRYGQEFRKYLSVGGRAVDVQGWYHPVAINLIKSYYSQANSWDSHVSKTEHPYSDVVFEKNPLNRIEQQGAPGADWQPYRDDIPTSGHTGRSSYGTNTSTGTDVVAIWRVTVNGASRSANYSKGKLRITRFRNENISLADTSLKSGIMEEFRDLDDRVVLKRVWKSNTEALNTYYVYDDFGNLRYVIPPGYTTATVTDGNADFNELVYAYRYDSRSRLIEKKIPGKGWEYMVYNSIDQPILTQDSVQRALKKWRYTKYDAFGRIASSGIYTNASVGQITRKQVQILADAVSAQWESRNGTPEYTNISFPMVGLTPLVVNYYDDYTFSGTNASTLQPSSITKSLKTKTLLTGTKVSRDDGTFPLLTVNYYDDRGRLIQSASQNHLTGTDYVTNTYSFPGELLTSTRVHKPSASGTATTIVTTNNYDHVGRLKETRKKVNTQPEIVQSRLVYNEIGQLKQKKLHSENSGTNFITQIDYNYNERGWTTRTSSPHFTQVLKYNDPTVAATAQYNGNISQQHWGHGTTSTPNVFSYSYDAVNRLASGSSTGTVMSETLTYDNMGNIRTLIRDGGTITYTYNNTNKSNRLANLTGALQGSYTYDVNGNVTKDRTNMTIRYNHLNLPDSVYNTGATIKLGYLYDAMGQKLRRYHTESGTATQRDYISGIEYSKIGAGARTIEMIHTEEGYLENSSGTYLYRYNLTDHLGNVRATLQRTTGTTGTVVQKDDFYPFGKRKSVLISGINNYLYNGKEMQHGLKGGTHSFGSSYTLEGQYDYGARFYDAEIGRWNVMDPLAEQMRRHSPYNYAFNNPITFIDPDGMAPRYNWEEHNKGNKGIYTDDEEKDINGNYKSYSFEEALNYHSTKHIEDDGISSNGESTDNVNNQGTIATPTKPSSFNLKKIGESYYTNIYYEENFFDLKGFDRGGYGIMNVDIRSLNVMISSRNRKGQFQSIDQIKTDLALIFNFVRTEINEKYMKRDITNERSAKEYMVLRLNVLINAYFPYGNAQLRTPAKWIGSAKSNLIYLMP